MDTRTYSPVSPADVSAFRQQLSDNGYPLPSGNSGQAAFHGGDLVLGFSYDGTSRLTLTIVKNGIWFCPNSEVWSVIESHLPAGMETVNS